MTWWLLELTVGGRTYRFSTDAVSVDSVEFEPGLADPGLGLAEILEPEASVGLQVLTDSADWAALVAAGVALDRAEVALYRWAEGTTLDDATVVRGLTADPEYGVRGEVLGLTLRRDLVERSDLVPPPRCSVDVRTWPVTAGWILPEDSDGAAYPLVIGVPGDTPEGARPAVPVPVAEAAEGDSDGRVVWLGGDAADVALFDLGAEPRGVDWPRGSRYASRVLSTETVSDGVGRSVESVRAGTLWRPGGEWHLGFRGTTGRGGGIRWQGRLLRGAGDVIAWALDQYGGRVDQARLRAVRAELNGYLVDTWIAEPVPAWSWLRDEVLPWLPVTLLESPAGVYPAVWRWGATAADAVAHLDVDAGSERQGRVSIVADEVVNEVVVEFRPSAGRFLSRRIVTAAAAGPDRRVVAHPLAIASQARYGVRPAALTLQHTWDAATALRVAVDHLERTAWPRRALQYRVPAGLERRLGPSTVVTLSDPGLYLAHAVAIVLDVQPAGPALDVDLLVLDRP